MSEKQSAIWAYFLCEYGLKKTGEWETTGRFTTNFLVNKPISGYPKYYVDCFKMDLNECWRFARNFPLCAFATAAGSQPRVRTLLLWSVMNDSFYFHTGASTNLAKEIKKNPKVEICFTAPPVPPLPSRMMRVSGFCEYVDDKNMKARLLDDRPLLISLGYSGPDDPELVIFRVHSGEIRFVVMETFLIEKNSPAILF